MALIIKGTRVRTIIHSLITDGFSLAGTQLKFPLTSREVEGEVKHIRANHPTNPTIVHFIIQLDNGEVVEVDQSAITAVVGE